VARKVARAAVAAFPSGEVEAALREAMHQAIGEPRIVLRAAPAVAEALRRASPQIAHEEGYDGRVQISADARSRARIAASSGGAAARNAAEAAIDAALDALMARHFRNAEAQKRRR
jgi:flagellar assembly protein FliH